MEFFFVTLQSVHVACTIAMTTSAAMHAITIYSFVLLRNPLPKSSSSSVLASVVTATFTRVN